MKSLDELTYPVAGNNTSATTLLATFCDAGESTRVESSPAAAFPRAELRVARVAGVAAVSSARLRYTDPTFSSSSCHYPSNPTYFRCHLLVRAGHVDLECDALISGCGSEEQVARRPSTDPPFRSSVSILIRALKH